MSNKKSFVLYTDSLSFLDELTNEQAGILFKAIKDFHNGINPVLEFGLKMAFIPLKNQFIRDSEKWEQINTMRKEHGKKGGRPPKAKKPYGYLDNHEKPNESISKQNNPVNGNVTVNDNVIVNETVTKIPFGEFWDLYEKKVGDKSKCSKKWESLSLAVQEKIIQMLPQFKNSISDKQFQPHPLTFLNGKRWEDELSLIPAVEKKFKCEAHNHMGTYYPILTETEFQQKLAAGIIIRKL